MDEFIRTQVEDLNDSLLHRQEQSVSREVHREMIEITLVKIG